MAARSSGAGRPTRSRPTGATCARYVAWLASGAWRSTRSTEDDVDRLRRAPAGRAAWRRPSVTRALVAVRALHRFLADEGRGDADPAADVERARGCRGGCPKALTEDEIDAAARRGRSATTRSPGATGPSSRCSTAPGCASPSWSACRCRDIDLDGGAAPGLRQGRQGADRARSAGCARDALRRLARRRRAGPRWRPSAGPAAATPRPCSSTSGAGGCQRQGAWGVVRKHGEPVGLGDRLTPARAAPLVRHPHARPRRRHPGRAGAARPRLDQHTRCTRWSRPSGCGRSTRRPTPGRTAPGSLPTRLATAGR